MKKLFAVLMVSLLLGVPSIGQAKEISDYVVESNGTYDFKVNLFDYWLQEGEDVIDPESRENFGINIDHLLLFHSTTDQDRNGQNGVVLDFGRWNAWDRSNPWVPVTGIVAPTLNENGYPVLNISEEDIQATEWISDRTNESLEYLFNPDMDVEYRTTYQDVKGLFLHSASTGDYYSSAKNFAEYNEATNRFQLYSSPAISGVRTQGQFFPLNNASDVFEVVDDELVNKPVDSTNSILNHYLGMTIETDFAQMKNGKTTNEETNEEQDMTFRFTGDDDIWIFIDGVLVSDMGGIHNELTTEINFATGEVVVKPGVESAVTEENTNRYYLGDIYEAALGEDSEYVTNNLVKEVDENQETTRYTYQDGTKHTMKIFFLERGNTDSNFEVEFWPNMTDEIEDIEEPTDPEDPETPVEPTDPETPTDPDDTPSTEEPTTPEDTTDIVDAQNPGTSDSILLILGVCVVSGLIMGGTFIYQRKIKKQN